MGERYAGIVLLFASVRQEVSQLCLGLSEGGEGFCLAPLGAEHFRYSTQGSLAVSGGLLGLIAGRFYHGLPVDVFLLHWFFGPSSC